MKIRLETLSFDEVCQQLGMASANRGYELRITEGRNKGQRLHAIYNSSGLTDVHLDIEKSDTEHIAVSVCQQVRDLVDQMKKLDNASNKEKEDNQEEGVFRSGNALAMSC